MPTPIDSLECLKCGHVREVADAGSAAGACPKCGAYYAKVEAAMRARAPAVDPANVASRPAPGVMSAGAGAPAANAGAPPLRQASGTADVVVIDAGELKALPFAHLIYVTLLLGIFAIKSILFLLVMVVGVVFAYYLRTADRSRWLDTHFTWQIRTFWAFIIPNLVVAALALIFGRSLITSVASGNTLTLVVAYYLGFIITPLSIAFAVWLIYRIAKGWIYLFKRRSLYG